MQNAPGTMLASLNHASQTMHFDYSFQDEHNEGETLAWRSVVIIVPRQMATIGVQKCTGNWKATKKSARNSATGVLLRRLQSINSVDNQDDDDNLLAQLPTLCVETINKVRSRVGCDNVSPNEVHIVNRRIHSAIIAEIVKFQ